MEESLVLFTIFGMAVVTYLPRLIPLLVLSGIKLPTLIVVWLQHVPPAVLAAMLLPTIILHDGNISLMDNLFFWAAIPTFIAAIISKGLFFPVLVGTLMVMVGQWIGR